VAFDEVVVDRPGDDLFIITPFFAFNFAEVNSTAEAFVSTNNGTTFQSVGLVGEAGYNGIDLADFGITGEVQQVRVVGVSSTDPEAVYLLTGVQATTGDFRNTRAIYDNNGNLVETIDPAGNSRLQTFDNFGRITSQTDADGNTTTFVYTGNDPQPTEVINPDGTNRLFEYNFYSQATRVTDELGNDSTSQYDTLGRPLSSVSPNGQTATNTYTADLLTSQTIAISATENRVTQLVYDDQDRVTQSTDANGGITQFSYDAEDNLLSVTDPVGNVTTFEYDTLQRLITRTDPLGNATTFSYDAVGNQIEAIDRNGRRRTFDYDGLNRLTAENWFEGVTQVRTIGFTYDLFGNLLTQTDPDSSYTFTYDVLNRVTSVDNAGTPNIPNLILTYTYNTEGNQLTVTDNFGVAVDSVYDELEQLTGRTWQGGGIDPARIDFVYNDRGDRTSTERFSDLAGTQRIGSSIFDYDESGRTTGITHLDAFDAAIADYDYTYDLANQLIQETRLGDSVDYSYDLLGQLTAADYALQSDEFYNYDANGNRTSSSVPGSNYVTGPNNQLLSDGEFNYEYDAEGNQIRKTEITTGNITESTYDHRNRLIRVEQRNPGGILLSESDYTYDGFDGRIAQTVDADGAGPQLAETTYFTYDGDNTWADFDSNGNVIARYMYGDQIDEILARWQSGGGTSWYLTDRLGSVRDLVGATGSLINTISYDTFGQVLAQTNTSAGDRFLFTAREFDAVTAQYFYRARYYAAATGRFTQQDPLQFFAGDSNLYRYVGNRVTGATDPSGRLALTSNATQSSKKDPAIARGANCAGRSNANRLARVALEILSALGDATPPDLPPPRNIINPPSISQPLEPPKPPRKPRGPRGGRGGKGFVPSCNRSPFP